MGKSMDLRNQPYDPLTQAPLLNHDDEGSDNDIELLAQGQDYPPPSSQHALQTWNNPRTNILKVAAVFVGFIVFGMNDSSLGALIQALESHYEISYRTASLSFLVAFSGYLIAALICDHLHRYLGMWGVSTLGIACQLACYLTAATAPPFALFVIAYGVSGFGNGLIEAAWNTWAGSLASQNEILGLLHGFYGLGGMICPAVATAMIAHGIKWNHFYFVMAACTLVSLVLSAVAFREDTAKAYRESITLSHNAEDAEDKTALSSTSTVLETLKSPLTWLVSLALFAYVGAEVSTGGWVTTFMIDVRHGDVHRAGYVATGFWTGITVGRMVLGLVAGKYAAGREGLLVAFYLALAIVLQFFFWVVPSLVVSAICVALMGVAIGPLYPSIVIVFLGKSPKHLHVIGVGVTAAAGGIGGAIMPFITGSLATAHGAFVLGPFVLASFVFMFVIWAMVIKFF